MRAAVLVAVVVAVVLAWAFSSTSAPCTGIPDKYGLDCSTSTTAIVITEETPSGCAFPAAFPCAME